MRKRLKKPVAILALLCLLLAGGSFGVSSYFAQQDARHARFLATGRVVGILLNEYSRAIERVFQTKDLREIERFYSDHYVSPNRGRWSYQRGKDEGDVAVWDLGAVDSVTFDRAELTKEIGAYLANIDKVAEVLCKIDVIEEMHDQRIILTVKFILDGIDRQGMVFQDRHFYRWHLVKEGTEGDYRDWRIVRDQLVEGVRVGGNAHGFVDADLKKLGIDFKHQRDPRLDPHDPSTGLKFQLIQHASGGVSVVDYNNDGRPDIFFADGRRCRLYRNDGVSSTGMPRFTDVTRAAGLDGMDAVNAGIFADVDNDGHKDLLLVRYCATCKFFHNNGDGTFTDRTADMGLDLVAPCTSACFLDYDRDGFVDVYIGVYGDAFKEIPRLPFYARNGAGSRLFRNLGGKRFVDVTAASGAGDTGWTLAVAAGDFDNDGYPDLALANDFGRKSLLRNNGNGTFSDVAKKAGVLDIGGGMGVAFGDLDNRGQLDLYFANINSNQRWFGEDLTIKQYIRNVTRTRWLRQDFSQYKELYQLLGPEWTEVGKMIGRGNTLFANNGDGTFREMPDSHTSRAGWSWGVALFDMDNDTDLDIFVANGWISSKPKTDL
jgi:hypothetical protein